MGGVLSWEDAFVVGLVRWEHNGWHAHFYGVDVALDFPLSDIYFLRD